LPLLPAVFPLLPAVFRVLARHLPRLAGGPVIPATLDRPGYFILKLWTARLCWPTIRGTGQDGGTRAGRPCPLRAARLGVRTCTQGRACSVHSLRPRRPGAACTTGCRPRPARRYRRHLAARTALHRLNPEDSPGAQDLSRNRACHTSEYPEGGPLPARRDPRRPRLNAA
jgi:hypothetical protein